MKRTIAATTACLAILGGTATGVAAAAAPAARPPVTPQLPEPTGPYQVGTTSLHLVDRSRHDPLVPSRPYRDLMASVFYPARDTAHHPVAPQLLPGAAAHFATGITVQDDGLPTKGIGWAGIRTRAHENAPVDRRAGALPVVLYSPGLGDDRTWNTAAAEDLASRGYAVVTIDHTYEASEVEFPGGRVVDSVLPRLARQTKNPIPLLRKLMAARVEDTKFVLDQLSDVDRHGSLAGALDLHRIGMFGHSAGGFTAAETMHEDPRIAAGLNMDGTMAFSQDDGDGSNPSPVVQHGLDRPFVLMGSKTDDHYTQASWSQFWTNDRGWKRDLLLRGSEHASFTDAESIVPQLVGHCLMSPDAATGTVGFVRPDRAVANTRAYVAAFFDRWLRHRDDHLLDGASRDYPETVFIP